MKLSKLTSSCFIPSLIWCDFLYEEGLLSVEESRLRVSNQRTDQTALTYAKKISGREVFLTSNQSAYFAWHFTNRFKQ
jgi:hypothetical protein